MGKITPTISFTSNSESVTNNPGPGSVSVSASITDSLSVDLMEQKLIECSDTPTKLVDGHDTMTTAGSDVWTPGTVGSYIFLKNNSSTTNEDIYVGIVSNCQDNTGTCVGADNPTAPHASNAGHLAGTDHETLRTFTLLPGEFAWFPWDYTGDIYYESKTGTPALEYWRWDKA